MYPWVTHMHGHLRGGCPHECDYCYTQHMRCKKFYQGPLTLKEDELKVNYGLPWEDKNGIEHEDGTGKTIFIEHMNDLFAHDVPYAFIAKVVDHCAEYPENEYVFQTKNPERAYIWMKEMYDNTDIYKLKLGTTIETNRAELLKLHSKAPPPINRFVWITAVNQLLSVPTFITMEPIMAFDLEPIMDWIIEAKPDFVNIGADSKRCRLPEPTSAQLQVLIAELQEAGIEIREKHNLGRLLGQV